MPRTPVYQEIISHITGLIRVGELKPGDKLPTIAELMVQFKCSDTPVKYALRLLDERGIIETHQGRGTYVAEPKS